MGLLALAVLAVSVWLACRADDQGAAFIAVIAMVVAIVVAIVFSPDARRLVGADRTRADARAALFEHAQRTFTHLALQLPPTTARAEIHISELIRVRTRSGRRGSTVDLGALYDATGARLVLVGEPGAGKSTAAVALLGALLERARADSAAPIPVLLRLSAWPGSARSRLSFSREQEPPPLEDWLALTIAHESGLRHAEVMGLAPQIVPILDGLDEVPAARRIDCARTIGRFIEMYPGAPIVVCSRRKEFETLPSSTTGKLPVLLLEPLMAEDLADFLGGVDAKHWEPVISEVRRPDSELAAALSTPLMVAVALDAWHDEDPAALVRASRASATMDSVRVILWDRWVQRTLRRTRLGDARSLAVALARTAEGTGAAELRIERTGSPATRWAWFLVKGAVAGAAGAALSLPVLAAMPFFMRFADFMNSLDDRFGSYRRTRWYVLIWMATMVALILLMMVGWWLPRTAAAAAAAGLGAAVLAAWGPVEIKPPGLLARHARQPFALPVLVVAPCVLQTAIVCWVAVSRLALPGTFAILAALTTGTFFGLDFAGHHWLARGWYRARGPGGRLPARLHDLEVAGFLRTSGDAYRFFHLELQRHLSSTREGRDAYQLENFSTETLFVHAIERVRVGDHAGALALWDRLLRVDPRNAAAIFNRANALRMLGRRGEALEGYRRAAELDRRDPDPYVARAAILRSMGQHEGALQEVDRALEIAPEHTRALAEREEILRVGSAAGVG